MYEQIIQLAHVSFCSDLLLFLCIIVVLGWSAWHIDRLEKTVKKLNEKGFSLIELVTITAIIATLAIIAIPQFANYRNRAYNDAMMSDLRTAITCQEAYFTDHLRYATPADEDVLKTQYNMYESQGVDIVILNVADSNKFEIEARHNSIATVYTYSGPGGSITKK